jgi:restriction endonuclease S subunit
VHRSALDLSEVKEIGATGEEIETKGLQSGDVLVVEGHASVEEIGRAALWDRPESLLFQNHLFRVRAKDSHRAAFLLEWINGRAGRAYIRTVAKSTSGLNTINSTVLKAMPVPEVSLDAQDALMGELELVDSGTSTVRHEESAIASVRAALLFQIFGSGE